MIQRIQTVYLLAAGLLAASLLKLRLADITVNGELYAFSAKGILNSETILINGFPVMVLTAVIAVLHIVIIAMYKQRVWQMRLTVVAIILLFVLSGLLLYFACAGTGGAQAAFKIPFVFPLAAIIFNILAFRSIRKDHALVSSLNRIR